MKVELNSIIKKKRRYLLCMCTHFSSTEKQHLECASNMISLNTEDDVES